MKYIFNLLSFLFFMQLQAQSGFNASNMTVTKPDLSINHFESDSTANAVVLYEYGNAFYPQGSNFLNVEIKRKIKFLNKNELHRANVEIYVYKGDSKEQVNNIRATTYNLENGEISTSQLDKSQIFTENYNERYDIVKFLLPNVREGSVITYSYTFVTPYYGKYYSWDFQQDLPKLYSEYNTSIPGNYEYHIKLIGNKPLDVNDQNIVNNCIDYGRASANCAVSKYIMTNIPAILPEDYMTTIDNYRSRIEYELKVVRYFDGKVKHYTDTWEAADKQLRSSSHVGSQLKGSSTLSLSDIPTNIKNENSPLKKAELIRQLITKNYQWNGINRTFNESVTNLLKEQAGTATEINMLLHNTLKQEGLEVFPVLVSTRQNGLPTKLYPVITEFNYMIVLLKTDEGKFFLDATDPYLAFGEIPYKCLNQYGRAIDMKYGSYWVDIQPQKPSTIQLSANLEFTDAHTLEGDLNTKSTYYQALSRKKSFFENPDQYIDNLDNKLATLTFNSHKVIDADKSSIDFNEEAKINWSLEAVGNNIYLNPILFKFYDSNPFKLQERTYPVDFGYKQAYLYNLKIKLNNQYKVKEIPEDVTFNLPNNVGSILFKTNFNDDEINLYFRFNINDTLFNYNYYEYFKEYFGKIVDINNNSFILLERKQS